ncbi:MAG: hypothetical protein CMJ42_02955 [Phyllobacteriaceae bacterium]|nr:hypothetical protein [Phyllobacteriaceae bacterium]MBA93069.1 hypothetical protein [Phyllobacteriaceae bacterium]
MITRRRLVTGAAYLSTAAGGAALGYAGRGQIGAAVDLLASDDGIPPPGSALVGAEFMRGETERVADMLLSRSEARWIRAHHGDVTDPFEILALLARD